MDDGPEGKRSNTNENNIEINKLEGTSRTRKKIKLLLCGRLIFLFVNRINDSNRVDFCKFWMTLIGHCGAYFLNKLIFSIIIIISPHRCAFNKYKDISKTH